MPEVVTEDAVLHVEIEGEGRPVTLFAHGLTNSCQELAGLTTLAPGTKVRFCFRGHGHSSSPERGYRFADFARDVAAVAEAFDADIAFGASLGAGAIAHLVAYHQPERFRKLVFLLPAGLDVAFACKDRMLAIAELIEGKPKEDAIEAVLADPGRLANYTRLPWLRDFDRKLLQELNPVGVPRAIREIIEDWPLRDRDDIKGVALPTLIIGREGDVIHPAVVARILAELMPNAELMMFRDEVEMYEGIPAIVQRVSQFITW